MRFHMTNGTDTVTMSIPQGTKDWDRVAKSNRPVSTALDICKVRLRWQLDPKDGAEDIGNWYPVPAPNVALEGLPEKEVA